MVVKSKSDKFVFIFDLDKNRHLFPANSDYRKN